MGTPFFNRNVKKLCFSSSPNYFFHCLLQPLNWKIGYLPNSYALKYLQHRHSQYLSLRALVWQQLKKRARELALPIAFWLIRFQAVLRRICSLVEMKINKVEPTNLPLPMTIFLGDTIISAAAVRNLSEGWCIQNNQFLSTDYGSNVPNATRAYATRFMRCSLQYWLKIGCLLHLTNWMDHGLCLGNF